MLSGGLLTKGAATTVKGLNRVQEFGEAVGKTRVGRLVKLVNSKRAAVNRKVIGGLAKGSKKVAGPALSRAKTVGKTIRLYRLRKQVDVDAGDLSTKQEENLGSYLDAAGSDGADYINGLSPEQRRDFLTLAPCDKYTAASGASAVSSLPRDCDLTATQRDQAYEQFHRADDPYKVQQKVQRLDDDTEEEVLRLLSVTRGPEADTAVWMVENLPENRLEHLVKEGYDLNVHVDILHIYRKSDTGVKNKGDIGEIVAEKVVLKNKFEAEGSLLPKKKAKGVTFRFESDLNQDNGAKQEWDHIVIDKKGEIKNILETKISETPPDDIQDQLTNALDVEDNKIIAVSPEQDAAQAITADDFKNVGREDLLTVGPNEKYDVEIPYTSEAYHAAFRSARIIQEQED